MSKEQKTEDKGCNDKNCPKHGHLKLRGNSFVGFIKSKNLHKTAIVEWERRIYLRKYERYEKRKTKLAAHIPKCFNVKVGDKVKLMESRPISKTKNFVIIEVLKDESNKK